MQQTTLLPDPNERMLFNRLAAGDIDAFSQLFHLYNKRIYPFVLNIVKSETLAEDIVQEIFTQLWVKRETVLTWDKPQSYLFKMATNRTLDQLRKIARESEVFVPYSPNINEVANSSDTEAWLDRKESMQLIHEAVLTLPPQRLKVYQLFREQGLSYREIADQLGISVKTVHAHLQEATKQIKWYISNQPGSALALVLVISLFEH